MTPTPENVEAARVTATFTRDEVDLFRQWFNAVQDLSPAYLNEADRDLARKVHYIVGATFYEPGGSSFARAKEGVT